MLRRLYFQNQSRKKHHLAVQTLEFKLLTKDRDIRLREEHNIEFMHRKETLRAENARLHADLAAAQAISTTSNINHPNRVEVEKAHLVEVANLLLQVKALQPQPLASTQRWIRTTSGVRQDISCFVEGFHINLT